LARLTLHGRDIISVDPTSRVYVADEHTHGCGHGGANLAGGVGYVVQSDRDVLSIAHSSQIHDVLMRVGAVDRAVGNRWERCSPAGDASAAYTG